MTDQPTRRPEVERVLGKRGSTGEIRVQGDKPGRRYVVSFAWRGSPPTMRPASCNLGHAFGPPCAGFKFRRTCSHAERAVSFVREERSGFRDGRPLVEAAIPGRLTSREEPPDSTETVDELDLLSGLDAALSPSAR